MLVLSRKAQEQIRVGDNITISVLRVKGNSVRIGIEAPREVRVVRGELPDFSSHEGVDTADESAKAECASPGDDEPAALAPEASATLYSYLRSRRRRRSIAVVAG